VLNSLPPGDVSICTPYKVIEMTTKQFACHRESTISFQFAKAITRSRRIACLLTALPLLAVLATAQVKTTTSYTANTKFASVTVILSPHGPLSNEATVTGPFFLTVINRSGIANLHLSLTLNAAPASVSAAAAAELLATNHKDGSQDQTTLVELAPGTYYLTAQQNLGWKVKLVVNP
jgi:hypothetical protein